jgi:hypothetical protein
MKRFKMTKKVKIIVGILLVLLAIRIVLPEIMERTINWYLADRVEGYTGSIADFDLALWRGSYSMEGLELFTKPKRAGLPPILAVEDLDISLAWRALFKGKLLMDLEVNNLKVHFVDNQNKEQQQLQVNRKSSVVVYKTLIPFNIEKLVVRDSSITFMNTTNPKVPARIDLSEVRIDAENINNNENNKKALPSHLELAAKIQKTGKLNADMRFNILQNPLSFDVDYRLENFELKELNQVLMLYGPLSFTSGKLAVYGEAVSRNNRVKGYIKPFVTKIDVMGTEEIFKSFKHFGLELISAAGNLILRSPDEKLIATKVEFEGALKAPDIEVANAFWTAVKNAFNQELEPKIDNNISLKSL